METKISGLRKEQRMLLQSIITASLRGKSLHEWNEGEFGNIIFNTYSRIQHTYGKMAFQEKVDCCKVDSMKFLNIDGNNNKKEVFWLINHYMVVSNHEKLAKSEGKSL